MFSIEKQRILTFLGLKMKCPGPRAPGPGVLKNGIIVKPLCFSDTFVYVKDNSFMFVMSYIYFLFFLSPFSDPPAMRGGGSGLRPFATPPRIAGGSEKGERKKRKYI